MENIRIRRKQCIVVVLLLLCMICVVIEKVYAYTWLFYCILFLLVVCVCVEIFNMFSIQKTYVKLSENLDAIIDHKALHRFDGEDEIAYFAYKIERLNMRYHGLIADLDNEKQLLKKHIENIAHQLKTPLSSLLLESELLLETYDDERIKAMQKHLSKMQCIIQQLLSLAKLDSGKIDFHFDDYDLDMLIDDLDYDNVTIHKHIEDIKLYCDEVWFIEMLKNIMKNYLERNDEIDINAYQTDALTCIQIKDYGQGFDEEDLPHLFERFYKGKESRGVGIGLALAKDIVEKHHGTIVAYNRQGAVMEMTFPKLLMKKSL